MECHYRDMIGSRPNDDDTCDYIILLAWHGVTNQ